MTDALPPPAPFPTTRVDPLDPPPELGRLRESHPVSRLAHPDGSTGWLVTGHALVRQVLADPRFSSRTELLRSPVRVDPHEPAPPGMFIGMDEPEHARYRKLLTGQFTVRRTRALAARIERIVGDRLDAIEAAGPPADLVRAFALPVPSLVICELLGVPYDFHEDFQRWTTAMVSTASSPEESRAAEEALTAFLADIVAAKRTTPTDDLLGGVIAAGGLTDEEAVGIAMLLLVAGHETTSGMLSLGTFALLRHPDQLALLRADPTLVDGAIEELLRYLSITQFEVAARTALVDVELGGRLIRAGEPVTLSIPAANRDPAVFADPDDLDITRSPNGHVAFGHGAHACLGQQLARAELRVALPALLRRFPRLRLAVAPEEVPLRHRMPIYGAHRLPVTW
ncbi:cytochrome P450 [Streptomyces millisiae]|uniref:Cytochrome P450 n=1 Tax=Streptomyces millisiae TaxID=3075542 RepID=A0ABU2M0R6_9ACTN|nr:cytochrome P450 [Streptomyces sp. DSM 44918]MDT0323390.1 cytochrome P450 [Streptomyces sp. DSM 44918]